MTRVPRGFTLVELLVTLSLIAVILMTTTATVVGGLGVWGRFRELALRDQQFLVAFEAIRRDLHYARPFAPIPFDGTYDAFSFPVVHEIGTVDGVPVHEPGRMGYYFDTYRRTLYRSRHSYRGLQSVSLRDGGRPFLDGVDRIRFEYFVPEGTTGGYHWSSSWKDASAPAAVRVEIGYRREGRGPVVTRFYVIHMPVAHAPKRS